MKEITKIEPTTVIDGNVQKITVFYSSGDPVVFVPETVSAEVVPELSNMEIEDSLKDSLKVTE